MEISLLLQLEPPSVLYDLPNQRKVIASAHKKLAIIGVILLDLIRGSCCFRTSLPQCYRCTPMKPILRALLSKTSIDPLASCLLVAGVLTSLDLVPREHLRPPLPALPGILL